MDSLEKMPDLDPAKVARAISLAHYSQGLIDEHNDNFTSALSNFQQAVALDPDNEELNLRVAVNLLQQKEQEKSIAVVESFAKRHPESEKAQLFLALVYRAAEQYDKVERIYRRMIKRSPAKPDAYLELASLYLKQGNDSAAATLLERATHKVDDPPDLLRVLGGIYMKQAAASNTRNEAQKKRESAIRSFEQVLVSRTNDLPILFQLGNLYIRNEQFEKALDCFSHIEQLNPENLPLRRRLAMSFAEAASKDQAIDALAGLAKKRPDDPHINYYLGEIYSEKGDKTNALFHFSLALTHAPSDPAPFIKKAIIEVEDNPEAAIQSLTEGLVKLPGNPRLTEMLGYIFLSQKKYDQAIEYFSQAVEQFERQGAEAVNPALYYNDAIAHQMAGQIHKAAELLYRALDQNPVFLDAYLQYTLRRENEGGIRQSIAVLEAMGRARPDEPNTLVYLGILNCALKNYEAAIVAFEKAESFVETPQKDEILDASFYFWYAAACEREGQFHKAEELFMKCLEIDPQHAEACNYLAYMWAEKGVKLEQALQYIRRALKLNPKSGSFIDTLGWIYYMNGQYKESLEQINRAAEIMPDDPTIADHLGDVLYKLSGEKEALPHWEKSFVLDPENEKVAEKLAEHGADLDALRKQADELKSKKLEDESTPPAPNPLGDSEPKVISPPVLETNVSLPDLMPAE